MAMQTRTWWFDKKSWNQGVRDGSRLIFWSLLLSAFATLLLLLLVPEDPLGQQFGNAIDAIAICFTTAGWWQLTRPVDGLNGPKTTVMVMISRRFVLFWVVCALIVGLEWFPGIEGWGNAPFLGKLAGRALSILLGYIYLLQIFTLCERPALAKASLGLGLLYGLTYLFEILLLVAETGETFVFQTNLAFTFETVVGILSLVLLWQVHSVVTPERHP
jgi:hypothetical protein